MRTLLICLAFMVLVSGCAITAPRGMESMGSVDQFRRDSGNSTQVTESYPQLGLSDRDINDAVIFAIDGVVLGFDRLLWWE